MPALALPYWLALGFQVVNVVAIGIGGSFLGPLFVHTALRHAPPSLPRGNGGL